MMAPTEHLRHLSRCARSLPECPSLSERQLACLAALARLHAAGEKRAAAAQIAVSLATEKNSVAATLAQLEQRGLVATRAARGAQRWSLTGPGNLAALALV